MRAGGVLFFRTVTPATFVAMDERPLTQRQQREIIYKVDDAGQKVPFSIVFSTHDKRRPKPSKHMRFDRVVEAGAGHSLIQHRQFGIKPLDGEHPQMVVNWRLIERLNGHRCL